MKEVDTQILLNKDIDDLLEMLGKNIIEIEDSRRAFPPTRQEMIKASEKFFSKKWDDLTSLICSNESIINSVKSNKYETIILISTIADLISSIVVGLSPIIVATVIYKYGVTKICGMDNE